MIPRLHRARARRALKNRVSAAVGTISTVAALTAFSLFLVPVYTTITRTPIPDPTQGLALLLLIGVFIELGITARGRNTATGT